MNGGSGHEGGCKICSVNVHPQQCKRWRNIIVECGNFFLGGLKVVMAWKWSDWNGSSCYMWWFTMMR
jgi:hypothetical protein